MRIVWHELKKIWNFRILVVVALLCTLYYWLFLSFYIDYFPNGHSETEEVAYSRELLQRYGPTLEEDEYSQFIRETRAQLLAEMESYIKSNPVFADAGIYSFEDYERVYEKSDPTEAEYKAIWTLLGEECDFVRFKLQALQWIESQYANAPQYTQKLISETTDPKEVERLKAILQTKEYRNIMDGHVYDNTVVYAFYFAILAVLAVLVLVSPLIVTDRARNVHLLQYTSKEGRRILQKQFLAVLLSAFFLTTILILIFGAIYSTNGTWVYWNSGLTSFLNWPTFLFNLTYGQYILIYIVLLYVLCLGTAALAFIFSQFSQNLVTLILRLIPLFTVLTVLCAWVFKYPFTTQNFLYRALGLVGMEAFICGLLFLAAVAVSLYLVRREKKVEV